MNKITEVRDLQMGKYGRKEKHDFKLSMFVLYVWSLYLKRKKKFSQA